MNKPIESAPPKPEAQPRESTCAHCSRDMNRNPYERCSNGGMCVSIQEFDELGFGRMAVPSPAHIDTTEPVGKCVCGHCEWIEGKLNTNPSCPIHGEPKPAPHNVSAPIAPAQGDEQRQYMVTVKASHPAYFEEFEADVENLSDGGWSVIQVEQWREPKPAPQADGFKEFWKGYIPHPQGFSAIGWKGVAKAAWSAAQAPLLQRIAEMEKLLKGESGAFSQMLQARDNFRNEAERAIARIAELESAQPKEDTVKARSWHKVHGRPDVLGVRTLVTGQREYLMHNEALSQPYYVEIELKGQI